MEKVAKTPYPESYLALKEVFMQRSPRMEDINGYAQHQWKGIFHVVNWIFVAQALNLISPEKCLEEIQMLSTNDLEHVVCFMNNLNKV